MRLVALALAASLLCAACGGGGGGGGSAPPSGDRVLYVNPAGNDGNDGLAPDRALQTLTRAASLLRAGDTVYVAAGTYTLRPVGPGEPRPTEAVSIADVAGTAANPVQLIADIYGEYTGGATGDVVINAANAPIGIRVSRSSHIEIDGFRIIGARGNNGAGIQVRSNSPNVTIRNCVITNSADGIRVEGSDDVLIFNNLIYRNDNRGIRINAARNARIFNNTIVNNRNRGVSIGGTNDNNVTSTGATLRNNVIQNNSNVNVSIETGPPSALVGYVGNFNLVYYSGIADQSRTYRPTTIVGAQDVNADAIFVDESRNDYRLDPDASPAIDAGTGQIPPVLAAQLYERSTLPDGTPDRPPLDMGYHYPLR